MAIVTMLVVWRHVQFMPAHSSNVAQLVQQVATAPWGDDACQARGLGAPMRLIKLLGRGSVLRAEHSTLPSPTRVACLSG